MDQQPAMMIPNLTEAEVRGHLEFAGLVDVKTTIVKSRRLAKNAFEVELETVEPRQAPMVRVYRVSRLPGRPELICNRWR